ncbi:MAG: 3-methyl-2-oxobutanoate hydroxymethyltransferase [Candidatus Diapherotrites archaeon]|nr:3-methyl-2-oxobutanoate hydroxymethyltransferase [Candidatus Diapherotrites archaeon]
MVYGEAKEIFRKNSKEKFSALKEKYNSGKKIVMLTSYDYPTAKILDAAGIDLILVGDSLAMAVLGLKDTKSMTMMEMTHHAKAVCRAVENAIVVGDMPINTYNSPKESLENAKKFMESGCDAVKLEGCKIEEIQALVNEGIPVMAHLGLLPQTAEVYKVQGRTEEEAERIFKESIQVDKAGAFSLVLECVPTELGKKITANVNCPTIGIVAGIHCSGQVLVINDILGLDKDFNPKFVKKYLNLHDEILGAVKKFKTDVEEKKFPAEENSF